MTSSDAETDSKPIIIIIIVIKKCIKESNLQDIVSVVKRFSLNLLTTEAMWEEWELPGGLGRLNPPTTIVNLPTTDRTILIRWVVVNPLLHLFFL